MKLLKFIPFITLLGCNNPSKDVVNRNEEVSTEILTNDSLSIEIEEKDSSNDSISTYFNNPMNFYELKKATTHMHSGGNFTLSNELFHSVEDDRYVYYDYWAIELDAPNLDDRSLSFKVLKPWSTPKEKYYEADNEILIGIKSKIAWDGLKTSNFVGRSVEQIKKQFDDPNFDKNECLIYYLNDKLLVFKIDNEKVKWFKYVWLRTDFDSIKDLPNKLYEW